MNRAVFLDRFGAPDHFRLGEAAPGAPGPGTSALIYGAAGGVGSILAQWAKSLGATVIGVASSRTRSAAVYTAYLEGAFALPAIAAFPLERVADAHRAMENRSSIGPVVLTL